MLDNDIQEKVQAAIAAGAPRDEAIARGQALQARRTQTSSAPQGQTVDQPQAPVPQPKSVLQGNLSGDNLVSGNGILSTIANAMARPFVKSGQNIAGAGYELYRGAKSALGDKNAYYNADTGQTIQNPFLSEEKLKQFSDNPRQALLDQVKNSIAVASYGVPFGKAGFIGSKAIVPGAIVGGAQALPEAKDAEDIAKGALYGGATAGVLQGAGELAKGTKNLVTGTLPERIMNSVFKEPIKDTRAAIKSGQTLGQEALDKGTVGTTEGIYNKAVQKINDTEDLLQSQLMESKGRTSFTKVEEDIKPYLDELKQSGNPAYQTIVDRIKLLKETNGVSIPDVQANQIKRSLYDEVRPAYGQQAPPGAEGIKKIAKSLKDQIAENNEGVDQLNKDLSVYGRQADAMIDKAARNQRNNIVGLSDIPLGIAALTPGGQLPAIAGYLGKKALGTTVVQTGIAQGLNKAGKVLNTLPPISGGVIQAGGQVVSRLPSIPPFSPQSPSNKPNQTNQTEEYKPKQGTLPPITPNVTQPTSQSQIQRNPLAGYKVDGQPISPSDANLIYGIANYKIDPTKVTSLRGNERQRLMGLVAQYDPSYDQTQYGARSALRKDFTSGKGANNIRSLNTAIGHLASLAEAGNNLGNTFLPAINTVKNVGSQAIGQPQVTKFNDAVNAVAGEMATVFKGTSGTDQEIKSWKEQMNASQSPEQIKQGINQMIELMGSRLAAFNSQWESGMGKPKDFRFLSEKSRQILKNLGEDVDAIDPMSAR